MRALLWALLAAPSVSTGGRWSMGTPGANTSLEYLLELTESEFSAPLFFRAAQLGCCSGFRRLGAAPPPSP